MTKFKFIGDPKTKEVMKDSVDAFGVTFNKGKASEVEDEKVIAKLRGNSHFSEVKPKEKKADK